MLKINTPWLIIIIFICYVLNFLGNKLKFKYNYCLKVAIVLFLYTVGFYIYYDYMSFNLIEAKLDMLVSISATLAGFIFTGLSIIIALMVFEKVKRLFIASFLDILFYSGYGSILLCILDVIMYFLGAQFELFSNSYFLSTFMYFFGASIVLLLFLLYRFVILITQLKESIKSEVNKL